MNLEPGKTGVDATLGGGSYSCRMSEFVAPDGKVIALDRDPAAIESCRTMLESAPASIIVRQSNFGNLAVVLDQVGVTAVDAVVFDLGVSSHQLEDPGYGIQLSSEGPLDMRMGLDAAITADTVINQWPEAELTALFRRYGEERWGRRIARRIVELRDRKPIRSAKEIADIVVSVIPPQLRSRRIHPATRVMLAIRVAVNDEEGSLITGFRAAIQRLSPGGRVAVVAYHSVEDRIVKVELKRYSGQCVCEQPVIECRCGKQQMLRILTKKPVTPSAEEVLQNPRARSARLRAAERLPD
ncbi:MAG: 16S rRNA (cytosine(1402)-N(4))-methyltransferase RsmH [Armatimonadetes bacterium]|nr:16S rRNA (cytosine(1402)-N(4))-methyltransferase RsmH [Armatimonadota bacterium]